MIYPLDNNIVREYLIRRTGSKDSRRFDPEKWFKNTFGIWPDPLNFKHLASIKKNEWVDTCPKCLTSKTSSCTSCFVKENMPGLHSYLESMRKQ